VGFDIGLAVAICSTSVSAGCYKSAANLIFGKRITNSFGIGERNTESPAFAIPVRRQLFDTFSGFKSIFTKNIFLEQQT